MAISQAVKLIRQMRDRNGSKCRVFPENFFYAMSPILTVWSQAHDAAVQIRQTPFCAVLEREARREMLPAPGGRNVTRPNLHRRDAVEALESVRSPMDPG
jgi:hypothetical protein